jgi:hypothetical protein
MCMDIKHAKFTKRLLRYIEVFEPFLKDVILTEFITL